tara:strand:+ start:2037 stop:2462 length:426 start_codon:yes stop_codon:yes gene_type:complete
MKYLLPTFIILPILEIYVFIKVGSSIEAFNTILLVLLTAIIGLIFLRVAGFQTLFNARKNFQSSELPAEEILSGFFLAIGGVLLLIPGFITDVIGFLCIFPITRTFILGWMVQTLTSKAFSGSSNGGPENDWIEGEYKKHE